jgi:hypothetical protein
VQELATIAQVLSGGKALFNSFLKAPVDFPIPGLTPKEKADNSHDCGGEDLEACMLIISILKEKLASYSMEPPRITDAASECVYGRLCQNHILIFNRARSQ